MPAFLASSKLKINNFIYTSSSIEMHISKKLLIIIFGSLTIFARMNIFLVQRWLAPLFLKRLEQRGKPTLDLKTKIINEPLLITRLFTLVLK